MNYCQVRRQPPTSATATFWLTQRRPRVTFGCSRCACPAHLAWITSLGTYRLGDSTLAPWRLAALAQAALVSRDLRTAGGLIVDALDMIGCTGVRWWEAEVHRSGGALLITTDETTVAEAFETTLEVAREQDAKSLELRAAASLA